MIVMSPAFDAARVAGPSTLADWFNTPGRAELRIHDGVRPGGAVVAALRYPVDPAATVGGQVVLADSEGDMILSGAPTWAAFYNGAGEFGFSADIGEEIVLAAVPYAGGQVRAVGCVFG